MHYALHTFLIVHAH